MKNSIGTWIQVVSAIDGSTSRTNWLWKNCFGIGYGGQVWLYIIQIYLPIITSHNDIRRELISLPSTHSSIEVAELRPSSRSPKKEEIPESCLTIARKHFLPFGLILRYSSAFPSLSTGLIYRSRNHQFLLPTFLSSSRLSFLVDNLTEDL